MKKYFLTGLVILMPVVLTAIVIYYLLEICSAPFSFLATFLIGFIQKKLSFQLPEGIDLFLTRIFSLLFICGLIFALGIFGHWFFIKGFFKLTHRAIARIPIVSSLYKLTRDIISAIFSTNGKKMFKEPVMLPFPSQPNFSIGFLSGEAPIECEKKIGRPLVSVFAPTAPHPISGFIFILPKDEILPLDMTNEDALKFLVSCGVVLPGSENKAEDEHAF